MKNDGGDRRRRRSLSRVKLSPWISTFLLSFLAAATAGPIGPPNCRFVEERRRDPRYQLSINEGTLPAGPKRIALRPVGAVSAERQHRMGAPRRVI